MEGTLLTTREENVDVTISVDSSSKEEQERGSYIVEHVWDLIEFLGTLALICAAVLVLTLTKDEEQPKVPLYPWIIAYTSASIANLPILCWRCWDYPFPSIYEVMNFLKMMIEYFFVVWVVVLIWHLINNIVSLDDTTPHIWLCLAFLAYSFVLHVLSKYMFALCCFCPMMLTRAIPLYIQGLGGPNIFKTLTLEETLEWILAIIEEMLDE